MLDIKKVSLFSLPFGFYMIYLYDFFKTTIVFITRCVQWGKYQRNESS